MGRYVLIGLTLIAAGVLLFARLGHNALWDDEAGTALTAKGVLRTGDTSVLLDDGNINAYRNGLDVRSFCDRSMPPLDAYLTAASFAIFGIDAWEARLPFALLGLATIGLVLFWARRESWPLLLILGLGLIGNVSLILFLHQCRYYAPSVFFSTALAYLYWKEESRPRSLFAFAGVSILLFLTNYLGYVALYLCMGVDYIIWRRHAWTFSWRNILILFGPQLVINGLAACIWNPLLTSHAAYETANSIGDRLTLFFWYWRDMDQCEFLVLPLLLLALGLGLVRRRAWLVRGCVAILVYVTVITVISPQPVQMTSVADVRYTAVLIPLAVALEAGALYTLLARRTILLIGAALIIFGTNLFNIGSLLNYGFRSTLYSYAGELLDPPPEPYTLTAQWINDNVSAGASVWVLPDYATYPLMFHAPRALYAWQLDWPPRSDFAALPPIHFKQREAPDYLIAFGPSLGEMAQTIQTWNRPGVSYERVATINVFWKDLYRPEFFWRTFKPITNFDPDSQGVYIFRRTKSPAAPP